MSTCRLREIGLCRLSNALILSSSTLFLQKAFSKKSPFLIIPLHIPLSINPRHPSEPSIGAVFHQSTIVLFRNDLRVHDNECLTSVSNESISVLPITASARATTTSPPPDLTRQTPIGPRSWSRRSAEPLGPSSHRFPYHILSSNQASESTVKRH